MSGTIWPVDAVSGAPSYTGRMLREAALTVLAGGATAARPFGGISGVRPGTSKTIGSMSGLNYTVTPFGGLVDGEASTLAGVYGFAFPANETGTINAQTGTARTDLLSVVINDPAEGDAGLPSAKIVYTAGPSPVSPGHGFDLYQVNVPATGGGSPTLTWIGPFTVAAGGIQPVPTTVYPASPYVGQYVDDASLGLLRWNGTSWSQIVADAGSVLRAYQAFSGNSLTIDTAANGNDLFTATYPAYEVEVNLDTTSAATGISVLMRSSGADYTTGNHTTRKFELNAATPAYANSTTDTKLIAGRANGTGGGFSRFIIAAPQLAQYTKLEGQSHDAAISQLFWGHIPNTNVFTGMKVILDSTITGTGSVTVRGLRKI